MLIWAALIYGLWAIGTWNLPFLPCQPNAEQNRASVDRGGGQETCPTLGVVVIRPLSALGRFIIDERKGIGDAVIALGTLMLAIFTASLWWATQRMQRTTERLWEAAKEQGQDTKRSIEIAERALVAGERAFIFAQGIFGQYEDHGGGMYHWRFRPTWENSGDTPTRGLRIYVTSALFDAPPAPGFLIERATDAAGTGLLPPKSRTLGGVTPTPPMPAYTPQDLVDVQEGRKFLLMWGWARYFDVFPNTPERVTRFCWAVIPAGNPFNPGPIEKGALIGLKFDNLHHHEGNCSDDECR